MDCNCSDSYCWSKIPADAVVLRDSTGEIHTIRIQEKNWPAASATSSRKTRVITIDEWIRLCDNMRCSADGTAWVPYALNNK